jgi:hypothetical protein
MSWEVVARPQAEIDTVETADWYDTKRAGLGVEFVEEVLTVFDALKINPLLNWTASHQEHPLALSKKIPLSRDLRSDRRFSPGDHCGCGSCRQARSHLARPRVTPTSVHRTLAAIGSLVSGGAHTIYDLRFTIY